MKTYKELNLKQIRDEVGLDFAHFTYQRGMCSCCFGPKDLPSRYWKFKRIPFEKRYYDASKEEVLDNECTFLLFKNANNGSGVVTRNDVIEDYTCIEWAFPMALLDKVCMMLKEQLGEDYEVIKPSRHSDCIIIRTQGAN